MITPIHDQLFWQQAKARQDAKAPPGNKGADDDGDDGDEDDAEVDALPWMVKAHQASAKAFKATATAHQTGTPEDHEKAMNLHAQAHAAHTMAGNDKQAQMHLDQMKSHQDCMSGM